MQQIMHGHSCIGEICLHLCQIKPFACFLKYSIKEIIIGNREM